MKKRDFCINGICTAFNIEDCKNYKYVYDSIIKNNCEYFEFAGYKKCNFLSDLAIKLFDGKGSEDE